MKIAYAHTLNGYPATMMAKHLSYAGTEIRLKLCATLKEIRRDQATCRRYLRRIEARCDYNMGWIEVEVPDAL